MPKGFECFLAVERYHPSCREANVLTDGRKRREWR